MYLKLHSLPVLLLLSILFISCSEKSDKKPAPFWPSDKSPEEIGKLVTADIFTRSDFMMYDTEQVKALHYAEVGATSGALRLAGLTGDEQTLKMVEQRYQRMLDENIPNTVNHVDANVVGVLPLELYLQTGKQAYLEQGIMLADSQWVDPLPSGLTNQTRFWIDDVWMVGALQLQAFRATGDSIYLDRAALQTVAYLDRLQKPNGLFHHGEGAPFFWGRGNGWVAAGMAEILTELPPDHPEYPKIVQGFQQMMNALLEYQAEDGMWRQLIDYPDSWKETSSTAMFGYAFVVGVKKGILPEQKFKPAYEKTWLALTNYINEDGKVTNVCAGTGQSKNAEYYLNRPKITGDFHGQAPVLWFAWALMME